LTKKCSLDFCQRSLIACKCCSQRVLKLEQHNFQVLKKMRLPGQQNNGRSRDCGSGSCSSRSSSSVRMGVPSNNPGTNDYVLVENLDVNCPNHYKYPGRAGKGCFGELMVMAASSKVILRCSSSNTQCTGLVKAADYPGGCICPYDIVKGQLIMRKQRQDGSFKWVHLECIGKGSNEMDTIASVCYVCNEVISTRVGQPEKKLFFKINELYKTVRTVDRAF
jgi:hypothetical protein